MVKPKIPKLLKSLPDSLDSDNGEFAKPLGSKFAEIKEYIKEFPDKAIMEITMNYPRTAAFKKLPACYQKLLYMKIYNNLKCVFGMFRFVPEESQIAFEACQSGHWHAHAKITYRTRKNYYVEGFIAEVVKCYLAQLPKKYSDYVDNLLHREYQRYRCPSLVAQFICPIERPERVLEWETYINKYKDKENL